jgi:hypothetical protein
VSGPYRLIVTDTSPLFTLVLADALDVLLRPGLPVSIPDAVYAVYIEATRVRGAPGADRIVAWINDHLDRVRIIPTDIGIDQQRRLDEGRSIRGLGEQAAIETLDRFLRSDPQARALLLFEDTDIARRRAVVDERVDLISTGDFLRELEASRLIQSSDRIPDQAAAQVATSSASATRSATSKLASGFRSIFGAIADSNGESPRGSGLHRSHPRSAAAPEAGYVRPPSAPAAFAGILY